MTNSGTFLFLYDLMKSAYSYGGQAVVEIVSNGSNGPDSLFGGSLKLSFIDLRERSNGGAARKGKVRRVRRPVRHEALPETARGQQAQQ